MRKPDKGLVQRIAEKDFLLLCQRMPLRRYKDEPVEPKGQRFEMARCGDVGPYSQIGKSGRDSGSDLGARPFLQIDID